MAISSGSRSAAWLCTWLPRSRLSSRLLLGGATSLRSELKMFGVLLPARGGPWSISRDGTPRWDAKEAALPADSPRLLSDAAESLPLMLRRICCRAVMDSSSCAILEHAASKSIIVGTGMLGAILTRESQPRTHMLCGEDKTVVGPWPPEETPCLPHHSLHRLYSLHLPTERLLATEDTWTTCAPQFAHIIAERVSKGRLLRQSDWIRRCAKGRYVQG